MTELRFSSVCVEVLVVGDPAFAASSFTLEAMTSNLSPALQFSSVFFEVMVPNTAALSYTWYLLPTFS